ncbi:MAG: hypothetical protein M3457_09500 [Chloroflexota bacterium]|nr:hypothetical protein [Chloroflexota bacterium]
MATNRRFQNLSLQPTEWLALRWLAREERDGKVSPAAARLIENEMRSRLGPNWRDELLQIIGSEPVEREVVAA